MAYYPPNYKMTAKDYIKLFVVLTLFGAFVLFVISVASTPIPAATYTEVWDALASHGYSPEDGTEYYDINYPTMLVTQKINCFSDDGMHFEFFIFADDDSADSTYTSIVSELVVKEKQFKGHNVRTGGWRANFVVYTLKVDGMYYYLMRIDNTLLYGFIDAENSASLYSIAKELGYVYKRP